MMKQIKMLKYGGLLLLVINIGLICFICFSPKMPPPHEPPKNKIISELQFDKNQVKKYESAIQKHRKCIDSEQKKIRQLKRRLYENLKKDNYQFPDDSILNEISTVQQKIEQINYRHFTEIRLICTDKQLASFKKLVGEFDKLFSRPKPPKKSH